MLITVCVCTYKRPEIVNTLTSIAGQILPADWQVEIVVVDNDEEGSAQDMVRQWAARHAVPVFYDMVPGPNISAARNRTLELARGEWLAFLDDDERANPTWLRHLVGAAIVFGSDAVIGPVVAVYPPATPQWLRVADPLSRDWGESGETVPTGSTANAVVRAEAVRAQALRFDEALGRTGGEDTDFFHRFAGSGHRIVVCDEAVVAENVPPQRLEPAYLRRRAMRAGQSYGRMQLHGGGHGRRTAFLIGSAAKAAGYLALSLGLARLARATAWRLRTRGWLNLGKVRAAANLPVPVMY